MRLAILTSPGQWFEPYARELAEQLKCPAPVLDHTLLYEPLDVLFILGYHKVIPHNVLDQNGYNLVVHESHLPFGRGWSPLFWQILDGASSITFSLIEAVEPVDSGPIYMTKELTLDGSELNEEIREKQAFLTAEMCLEFIQNFDKEYLPTDQLGEETYFQRRKPSDSELDVNKTIKEQFNLLRVVNNEHYPAYFDLNGHRYKLQIHKMDNE